MIKAIIFDLDGVLVDARELHYEALNRALEKYNCTITRDEHLSTYDGLPTKKKLQLLTKNKGLVPEVYDTVWKDKQTQTREIIDKEFTYDERIRRILSKLRNDGYRICVCSNSIRETIKMMLIRRGFMEFVEIFISNQDVKISKPNPEMYLRAMIDLGVGPKECVIVEDSHYGRQAAFESGGHLCAVENSDQVTYEIIKNTINKASEKNGFSSYMPKWQGGDLQIVIPMAGAGKSFEKAGYKFPKFLVDIAGKPMIQWVVENINSDAKFIYIVTERDYNDYNLKYMLPLLTKNCEIVRVNKPTEGAPQTVLAAENLIDNDKQLAIINSDQFLDWNSNEFFYAMAADECDGGVVTFESTHPMYSFVKVNEDGFISECAEKKPISRHATAGVYYFRRGSDFIVGAKEMMQKEITTNGQYFICPVYNELIGKNFKIRKFDIKKMWSFAVPEEIEYFVKDIKNIKDMV